MATKYKFYKNKNFGTPYQSFTKAPKGVILAGVVGFEPTQAVLETDVLPLTLYPYMLTILILTYLFY